LCERSGLQKSPNGSAEAGQFMDVKSDGEPFKGVAKERDGRRSDEE
jgi:hypothetical protein